MCFVRLLSGCGSRVDNHRRVLATLAAGLAKRKLGGGEQHRQPDDAGDHGDAVACGEAHQHRLIAVLSCKETKNVDFTK